METQNRWLFIIHPHNGLLISLPESNGGCNNSDCKSVISSENTMVRYSESACNTKISDSPNLKPCCCSNMNFHHCVDMQVLDLKYITIFGLWEYSHGEEGGPPCALSGNFDMVSWICKVHLPWLLAHYNFKTYSRVWHLVVRLRIILSYGSVWHLSQVKINWTSTWTWLITSWLDSYLPVVWVIVNASKNDIKMVEFVNP